MKNITVLISAPADQSENVDSILEVIDEFNDLMNKRDVNFLAIHWQKNITTGRAERAQDVINAQIKNADMIISVVGTRMGTDTGVATSGTAEEVFDFCKRVSFENNTYNTHIFFNTKFDGDILSLDAEQLGKVQVFRKDISDMGILYAPFSTSSTLGKLTRSALDSFYYQSEQTAEAYLSDEELEELGLDEYFELSASNLGISTKSLGEVGVAFSSFNDAMENAGKSGSPEDLLNKGADAMNTLGDEISEKVSIIQEAFDITYTSTMSATEILIEDFSSDENKDEVSDLIKNLRDMIESGQAGYQAMLELEGTIRVIPRRNKKLIKAKKKVLTPISKLKKIIADFNNNMSIVCDSLDSYIS